MTVHNNPLFISFENPEVLPSTRDIAEKGHERATSE